MKIKEIISQNRRDFHAIYICESCGDSFKHSGYDDRKFHDNVIPNMECKKCGKSSIDLGSSLTKTETVYPEWLQV